MEDWKAYSYLTVIQRRWAHLIREVDAFMNTDHGKELSEEIHKMFKELKEFLKSGNMDERRSMNDLLERRMEDMVRRYDLYKELHKPIEYLRNGLGSPASYIPAWNRQTTLLNRR